VWLGDGATSASSDAAKVEVAKLAYLEDLGADRLDLSAIPPERLQGSELVSLPVAVRPDHRRHAGDA
jgi:hypothetical protein